MLDKSIPYFNIVMVRKAGRLIPEAILPQGYSFAKYTPGDENCWAEIEYSVGEYANKLDALTYFQKEYLPYLKEIERRILFIQDGNGEKVATATCWWNYTGERRVPEMHWIAVKPNSQDLGLGKAIVFEGMRQMVDIESDREIYLHTQTWSYKAIGIYLHSGFEFIKTGSFAKYPNDYEKGISILKDKMGKYL